MRIIYLSLALIFVLCGCDSKHDCPACIGIGTVMVNGQSLTCPACNGKKKLTDDEYQKVLIVFDNIRQMNNPSKRTNQSNRLDTCPFCNGSGASFGGTCGFCNGAGMVSAEAAMQGRHVMQGGSVDDFFPSQSSSRRNNHGSSSNRSGVSSRICPTCNGSTRCPVCGGSGENSYYGGSPRICSYCYGEGKCPKCMGKGTIPN